MDPVDVESFKAATIQLVDMEDAEKTAALAEFDSCMAANYSLPYSFYSLRSDKMPGKRNPDGNRHSLTSFSRYLLEIAEGVQPQFQFQYPTAHSRDPGRRLHAYGAVPSSNNPADSFDDD